MNDSGRYKAQLLKYVNATKSFKDIAPLLSMVPVDVLKATLQYYIQTNLQNADIIKSIYYNSTNIHEILPLGVLSKCLSYLTFNQICDLNHTSKGVNKACQNALRSHHTLVLDICQRSDIRNTHLFFGDPFKRALHRVVVHSPSVLNAFHLKRLLEVHWHRFKHVKIKGIKITHVLEAFKLDKSMNHVVSLNLHMHSPDSFFKVINCNNLQFLCTSTPLARNTWNIIAQSCPSLHGFITDSEFCDSNSCINLHSHALNDNNNNDQNKVLLCMENLWILSVDECPDSSVEYVNDFLVASPNLKHLSLYSDIEMDSNRRLKIPSKLITLSVGIMDELCFDFTDSQDLRHLDFFLRGDPSELANDMSVFANFLNEQSSKKMNSNLSISIQFNPAFVRTAITELLDNVGNYRNDLLQICGQNLIDECVFYIYKGLNVEDCAPLFVTFLEKLFRKEDSIIVAKQGRVLYDIASSVFGEQSIYVKFCRTLLDLGYDIF